MTRRVRLLVVRDTGPPCGHARSGVTTRRDIAVTSDGTVPAEHLVGISSVTGNRVSPLGAIGGPR